MTPSKHPTPRGAAAVRAAAPLSCSATRPPLTTTAAAKKTIDHLNMQALFAKSCVKMFRNSLCLRSRFEQLYVVDLRERCKAEFNHYEKAYEDCAKLLLPFRASCEPRRREETSTRPVFATDCKCIQTCPACVVIICSERSGRPRRISERKARATTTEANE